MDADIRNFKADSITERIQSMLAIGLEPAVIARTIGVSLEHISQLLENDEFRGFVVSAKVEHAISATNRDRRLEKLEDAAIDKLDRALQMSPMMKPLDAARILSVVNATKRRGAESGAGAPAGGATVVTIQLPEVARVSFTMNATAQVVDVDGRSMAAMPTPKLLEMVAQRRQVIESAPAQLRDNSKATDVLDQIGVAQLQAPMPVRNVLPAA